MGLELGFKATIVVSAFADDVSALVKNNKDLQAVMHALHVYQRASSAKVNWGESGPLLPGGMEWNREWLKVLGVYLGSEGWVSRN